MTEMTPKQRAYDERQRFLRYERRPLPDKLDDLQAERICLIADLVARVREDFPGTVEQVRRLSMLNEAIEEIMAKIEAEDATHRDNE